MLESRHLSVRDYALQPWKNGRGETQEIAADPSDPFLWRVSRAELKQSDSFSAFPDYERILVIVDGGPVAIRHRSTGKEVTRKLGYLSPYRFQGAWETDVELQAPAKDFNVFSLNGRARSSCYPSYLSLDEEMQYPIAGKQHILHCVRGRIALFEPSTEKKATLETSESFLVTKSDSREYLNLRTRSLAAGTVALWVVIHF